MSLLSYNCRNITIFAVKSFALGHRAPAKADVLQTLTHDSGNRITGHSDVERQLHGYLILKIWTIFISTQIAGNDAHAKVYMSVIWTVHIYPRRELFTCYS